MKDNKTLKIVICGILIFVLGIIIGSFSANHTFSSVSRFLYAAMSEATDSNATDSNATDSNATNSDATASNATDSNYYNNDNEIYLNVFELSKATAQPGERVNVTLETIGRPLYGASVCLDNGGGVIPCFDIECDEQGSYFIVPKNIVPGTYNTDYLTLYGINSDETTFVNVYSRRNDIFYNEYTGEVFNNVWWGGTLTIPGDDVAKSNAVPSEAKKTITLKSFELKDQEVKAGENVKFKFKTEEEIESIKLTFVSEDKKEINVYGKDIKNNPVIAIPSNVAPGAYTLTTLTLVSKDATVTYTNVKDSSNYFDFAGKITIKENKKESYIYNISDIDDKILSSISDAPEGITISINADANPMISEELFKAISGKNKTLEITYAGNVITFSGKNLTDPKAMNVKIQTELISDSINMSRRLTNEGVIINFADNGTLPGTATIKVKITEEMKSVLGNKAIKLYYYNAVDEKFELIDNNIKAKNGYYEIKIDHTSKYVMVTSKIDDSLVTESSDAVTFQKSNTVNILLVVFGFIIIAAVIVVVIILNNKKNNSKSKINKEEKE